MALNRWLSCRTAVLPCSRTGVASPSRPTCWRARCRRRRGRCTSSSWYSSPAARPPVPRAIDSQPGSGGQRPEGGNGTYSQTCSRDDSIGTQKPRGWPAAGSTGGQGLRRRQRAVRNRAAWRRRNGSGARGTTPGSPAQGGWAPTASLMPLSRASASGLKRSRATAPSSRLAVTSVASWLRCCRASWRPSSSCRLISVRPAMARPSRP